MIDKLRYYEALKLNNGRFSEIELGETLGIDGDRTRELIAMLMSEHKIVFMANGYCNYSIFKKTRAKIKRKDK
jgi:hypothetical protein